VDFRAFHRMTLAAAAALHRRDLRPGITVALQMRDTIAHLAILFGLHRLGVLVLALDPAEPAAVRDALLDGAGAALVIDAAPETATPGGPGRIGRRPLMTITPDALVDDPSALPPPPPADAGWMVMRSSGTTTGMPKLSVRSHGAIAASEQRVYAPLGIGPGERYLSTIAFRYGYGRVLAACMLHLGATVVLPGPIGGAAALVDIARRRRITWLAGTPSRMRDLLALEGETPLLPGVAVHLATGPMTAAERAAVLRRVTPRLHMVYATNEVGVLSIARPEEIAARPETVGRPPPDLDAQAVDENGSPVPPGTVGELRFRHRTFPAGYLDGTPRGSSRFVDGWFYPGDLGLFDAEGYLFIKGRTDDQIFVSGGKVYPIEIEEVLTRDPRVAECVVVGLLATRSNAVAAAAVVLRAPAPVEELRDLCLRHLGAARVPRIIMRLDRIPKTPAGKPDRRALADAILLRLRAQPATDEAAGE